MWFRFDSPPELIDNVSKIIGALFSRITCFSSKSKPITLSITSLEFENLHKFNKSISV